uniref:DDE Tnp4 domain-containing protein n=1 Tax=Lactuca sativa TaxID=4236 RepID=A0A9R1WSJ5_LACSA|nr:hypothetical protein LSAT_V11C900460400 [Lactuca sativa]
MFFIFNLLSLYIHPFYIYIFKTKHTDSFKSNTNIQQKIDDDSDDKLVLHILLSAVQDMIRERDESSYGEKNHRKWINRDREAENKLLVHDYFAPDSLYDLSKFEKRFRISRNLFLRIARDLERNYERKRGFIIIQKCTVTLRHMGYNITADTLDEYLKMFERTGRECTYLFCEYVIEFYHDIYLRHSTKSDVKQLYVAHQAKHVFPGMLGSSDCIHWEWANCPNAWRGQFTQGNHGVPTVILETFVSHYLWFLHAFFGITGSNNDLNLLQASLTRHAIRMNGNEYKYEYYLGDKIYPEYTTIVKLYSFPADQKQNLFKLAQESA